MKMILNKGVGEGARKKEGRMEGGKERKRES
jgi:hypothetical protein